MSKGLYQILYCSRNAIGGSDADTRTAVESILEASRRNNAACGVTGALFYNSVFFAQVLEGSFVDVQRVFERLQMDPRHSDLVVLQSGYVPRRDFDDWWMACTETSPELAHVFLADRFSGPSTRANSTLALLRAVVLNGEGWALPERPSGMRTERVASVTSA